jgi:hypothetical protein
LFPKRVGCLALLSPAIFPDLRPFFLLDLLRKPVLGELSAPLVHALFWHVAMRRALPDARNTQQRVSFFQNFAGIAGPWKLMRLVRWGSPRLFSRISPRSSQNCLVRRSLFMGRGMSCLSPSRVAQLI